MKNKFLGKNQILSQSIFNDSIDSKQQFNITQMELQIFRMGSTCMGKPRGKTDLMQKKTPLQQKYISKGPNKVAREIVIGQSEGAHIKINKSLITCSICMQNYNTGKRQPVIACSNHHTYCRECLEAASAYNRKCPECRNDLLPLARNRDIYLLVEDNQKQFEENKLDIVKQQEQSSYINLTIDEKNNFIHNFWIEGSRIMKIQDNMIWQGFVSNETMYRNRECIFTVKVVSSKFNNIQIGVVGQGYQIQKNITCKQSVVYHLADGMILEGIPGRKSEWKAKGEKIAPGTPITIEVRVNIPSKSIAWYHQEKLLGKTRLSDYVLNHECVAYVLMSHKEDIVELNG